VSVHLTKLNPLLVGVGAVTDPPAFTVFDDGDTVPPFAFQVTVYWANAVPVLVAELEFPYPDLVALTVAVAEDPEDSPLTVTRLPDLEIEPEVIERTYVLEAS
jgi:hypothetical protein